MAQEKELTKEEIEYKIWNERDFICSKRFDNDINKLIARYPNGVPDRTIAQVLKISEDQIEELYQSAIIEVRRQLDVDLTARAKTPKEIDEDQKEANKKARERQ